MQGPDPAGQVWFVQYLSEQWLCFTQILTGKAVETLVCSLAKGDPAQRAFPGVQAGIHNILPAKMPSTQLLSKRGRRSLNQCLCCPRNTLSGGLFPILFSLFILVLCFPPFWLSQRCEPVQISQIHSSHSLPCNWKFIFCSPFKGTFSG